VIRQIEILVPQISNLYLEAFPSGKIREIIPLPSDMSPRRYFRLRGDGPPIVAMVFDSVVVPEAGGSGDKVDSFDAVLKLTRYLEIRHLAVPKIYASSKDVGIILQDDFGDIFIADKATEPASKKLYQQAIDQIIALRSAKHDRNFFALRRGFNEEVFFKEMEETPDFYLLNLISPPTRSDISELKGLLLDLAKRVGEFSQTLSLRDFHSWNILVSKDEALGVIDFQDALLAPQTYDLVSLLNDRDTDSLLGKELYFSLLEYFFTNHPDGEELRTEYPLVLLQRDLKVVGRLSKMVHVRGLPKYQKWVPGTARRVGRTLKGNSDPTLRALYKLLSRLDSNGFGYLE